MKIVLSAVALLALSACGTKPCLLQGEYLQAEQTGPLVNPKGGVPRSDPSYRIPPAPGGELTASRQYRTPDGGTITDCIDRPPRLTVPTQNDEAATDSAS